MARQEGIIKLKGRIGDLTFYKTKDGYQAREKGGVDGARIATDPRYQRTRENGAEFGRATKAGKLVRTAFISLTKQLADKRVSNRLMKVMLKVIQADGVNQRGRRLVLDAETELLKGFEFNVNGLITGSVNTPYVAAINRLTGAASINFAAFSALDLIKAPQGATHFKFTAAAAAINFEDEVFELNSSSSAILPVNQILTPVVNLACTLAAASTNPIFLLLGISFYQRVNTVDYILSNGAFNGLAVVEVNGV